MIFWPIVKSSFGCDMSSVCRMAVTQVLWLNRTSWGSATVPFDKAITSSYWLSLVIICSGLAAVLNAKLLSALCTCAELPYCILTLIVAFDTAAASL